MLYEVITLMQRLFGTTALPWHDWIAVVFCALLLYGGVELAKALERAWRRE